MDTPTTHTRRGHTYLRASITVLVDRRSHCHILSRLLNDNKTLFHNLYIPIVNYHIYIQYISQARCMWRSRIGAVCGISVACDIGAACWHVHAVIWQFTSRSRIPQLPDSAASSLQRCCSAPSQLSTLRHNTLPAI